MAYAVLVSLFNSTHKMLNPYPLIIPCNKQTIQSLHENIDSLMSFLENTPPHKYQATKSLEANIRDVGYKAEDILESFITKHSRSVYTLNGETGEFVETGDGDDETDEYALMLSQSLVGVIKGFESLMEQMEEIQSKVTFGGVPIEQMASLSVAGSSKPTSTNKFALLDMDFMNQVKENLFNGEPRLKVIPIVGMGGIGKTTLAKALIDEPFTSSHFDVRGWVTVSQQYSIKDVVEKLLKDIKVNLKKKIGDNGGVDLKAEYDVSEKQNESRQQLHKSFYGRRYVVVLDDLWDTEACDELLSLFPDWNNGSRIIVTTRQSRVGTFAAKSYHAMKLLNDDMSWALLRQVVFPQKENNCPPELLKIGKEIAKKCSGLPLTISVVGGLLSKEKIMTVQHWEEVAENMKSTEVGDQCLEILSLSYNHLPHHLKACFLYMGIFPEDNLIPVSRVIPLWVAEGFLKPGSINMEKVAEENLKELIERNLIMVEKRKYDGKPRLFKIHDLIRDLCIREARKEKFLCVLQKHKDFNRKKAKGHRRLSILSSHLVDAFDMRQLMPGNRSFLSFSICHYHNQKNHYGCELLKVLYMPDGDFHIDHLELTELPNLRLLSLPRNTQKMLNSISNLWDLQYIVITYRRCYLPQCIWFMPQLRHLQVGETELPPLPPNIKQPCVLKRLEVLSEITNFRCDDEVLVRIPNLRKLKIVYKTSDWSYYRLDNLVNMTKLETLRCKFWGNSAEKLAATISFPISLKKLSLWGCNMSWEHMDIVGVLPNLKILKLSQNAFQGETWETSENHFKKLEYLAISLCHIKEWIVEDADHFPNLRYIYFSGCVQMEEIPSSIGEIPTLETIEFYSCGGCIISSARNIRDEINNDLKVIKTGHHGEVIEEEEDEDDEEKRKEFKRRETEFTKRFEITNLMGSGEIPGPHF